MALEFLYHKNTLTLKKRCEFMHGQHELSSYDRLNSNEFNLWSLKQYWGRPTGIRGLMRGMVTFPQGNQEFLAVKDKVG